MPPAKKKAPRRKHTLTVEDRALKDRASARMSQAGFDPLEWSIRIATGEALTENHPFLEILQEIIGTWIQNVEEQGKPITGDQLRGFEAEAANHLTDSFVPLKLRSDHIRDLLQYVYPKLKATDHTGQIQHDMKLKPLTPKELKAFKDTFDSDY